MGADARWVCHTCMTVCPRGGKHIFTTVLDGPTVDEVEGIKTRFCSLMQDIELITDDKNRYITFLDDLILWLRRQEGHNTHVGNDYSTDGMDLEDYHDETVGGDVSSFTRHEVDMACFNEWEESSIRDIQQAIEAYADNREELSSRTVAEELFNRYGMRV